MSFPASKPAKLSKNQSSSGSTPSRTSSLSSHLAMVELKQRILTSLLKLSDRDTHHIAVDDLEKIIQSLSPEGVPMLLNCLYDASADPKPAAKKESLRLLALLCASHSDSSSTHLPKVIAHVVKRLKDSDSGVRDSCRDAIGSLSAQYLKGEGDNLGSVVSLFVKPLFEAMNEQNKVVQAGAAMCIAKMVECASDPPVFAFQKLCPRICKILNNLNYQAKAAILPVITSLSRVGAIAPQNLESLLHCIHDCLGSSDWGTRKAAADTLTALALHSSSLLTVGVASTLRVLEASRFDKIKPARDSILEALQLWKKIAGKPHSTTEEHKSESHGKSDEQTTSPDGRREEPSVQESSERSLLESDSVAKFQGCSISEKAVGILKKKAPALTDKELNAGFFQKLETRGSDDLPVEVIVPRKCLNNSRLHNDEKTGSDETSLIGKSSHIGNCLSAAGHDSLNDKYFNMEKGTTSFISKQRDVDGFAQDQTTTCNVDNNKDKIERGSSSVQAGFSKSEGQSDGSSMGNKGNWLAIQRQLLQLERQQTHLMNMLQDFMGGSHDSMATLDSRVRGLERVVEDMARDLSISSSRRGSNFIVGCEGSSNRPLSKYGFPDLSSSRFGRGGDARISFGERFAMSDNLALGSRGRDPSWRSDMSQNWEFNTNGASGNGQTGSRRGLGGNPQDSRLTKSENESDQDGSRRAWDKSAGSVRLGEGPSARSVWQASKDEATLEAIRVAGEDNGSSRTARVAVPEMTMEALGDGNTVQEQDLIWTCWSNAIDALRVGDTDSAYAEVLSTGDDLLLVKLMDRSGPVLDQLSNETSSEVLNILGQFLLEQSLLDICLSWIQQLVDVVMENGSDVLGIPMEIKKQLLSNLHEASLTMDPPDEWEGASLDQLMLQLASAWKINLQQLEK